MNIIWEHQRSNVPNIGKLGKIKEQYNNRIITKIKTLPLRLENPPFEVLKEICWIWNGTIQDNKNKGHKHGSLWFNGKYVLIHRLMFHNFIENVPIYTRNKNTLQINHKCNSDGKCINPFHMYLGTPKQNIEDCIRDKNKNKAASGEKNPNATVSDETVEYIKSLKGKTKKSQREIAEEYNISQSQISRWWNGKTRK